MHACGGPPPPPPLPPYLHFDDLVGHLNSGSTARLTVNSNLCTGGDDFIGGLPVEVFNLVERGTVGNEYSYLSFGVSSVVRDDTRGFLHNVISVKALEYQTVEIWSSLVDPMSFKAVESRNYTCKYGDDADGAVFHLVDLV